MSRSFDAPCIFPAFRFHDADRMIAWLAEAFGFRPHAVYRDETGTVVHAELALGSSMIMVGQARKDAFGEIVGPPEPTGGKTLYVAVNDADEMHDRAKAAGATIEEGLTDRDYGSREFVCRDPEGNVWCFGTYWPKADGAEAGV